METMFDMLLQLPLFQGMAHEDFTCILEKVKLHFTKHKSGTTLAKAGEDCAQLIFILKGEVAMQTTASDAAYSVIEYLQGPFLIEPQSLFGMNTTYAATYTASGEVHALSIRKASVMNELWRYNIFRMNFNNIICNRAQTLHTRLWTMLPDGAETRIVSFIRLHCERSYGKKVLKIKMEKLAQIINETRLTVSKVLNKLEAEEYIELRRGEIIIPQLEKLTEQYL